MRAAHVEKGPMENEASNGDPGVHLQGCGLTTSKAVSEIAIGDILIWNYGYTSKVTAVEPASACFAYVTLDDSDGGSHTRRMKLTRRVAWSERLTKKEAS